MTNRNRKKKFGKPTKEYPSSEEDDVHEDEDYIPGKNQVDKDGFQLYDLTKWEKSGDWKKPAKKDSDKNKNNDEDFEEYDEKKWEEAKEEATNKNDKTDQESSKKMSKIRFIMIICSKVIQVIPSVVEKRSQVMMKRFRYCMWLKRMKMK